MPECFPHGGDTFSAASAWGCSVDDVLDLSTGLHPEGPPSWLGDWLREHIHLVCRYPDPSGEPGRSALAEALDVAPQQVLITAGAQAAIEVVFQAMGWRSLAIEIPCYSEPIRCARRAGCQVRGFASGEPPAADTLWITSPHNPTGDMRPWPGQREGVLDESYMPWSLRRSMGLISGVIRIGSLTKTFCIPGLRLGYILADEPLIRRISKWLPPWPAATIALHLIPTLLKEAHARDATVAAARKRLTSLLAKHGWYVLPSQASFVLAQPDRGMPDFAKHRILVRRFPEWQELSDWVRFGLPGSEEAWQRLEAALCR